ncbi:MAG: 3-phenylpropionate/cinnamic acid dioxygenase ferredoxin subunit [Alphaproteobacteria bacterium ADurb.BinA305]|nr:MAG: 3-phenylpropionate/cinnamic acid dioxygenase ferredoxin subunit [Alphaproteobacteria bacterium ADurb.BinA305]
MAQFVKAATKSDIPEGGVKRVEVGGHPVALFNVEGEFHAIHDICSHAYASLSEGYVDGKTVECPLHGARFSILTGRNLSLPAVEPVARYEVKVEGDDIFVACE